MNRLAFYTTSEILCQASRLKHLVIILIEGFLKF